MSDVETTDTAVADDDGSLQAYIDSQAPEDAGDDALSGIIEIDVTNDKDPNEPAPHGNYRLRIEKYELSTSRNSGNPMIKASFVIVLAHDPSNADHVGKYTFGNYVIKGDGEKFGRWRHRIITEAVGLPLTGGPVSAYIGKEFDAELSVDPGNATNPPSNRIENARRVA
jgi:hypothetical protein